MTASGLIGDAARRLAAFPNPRLDAELLFRGVAGWSRADLLARSGEPLAEAVAEAFEAAVARRERHEPIQYILGRASFWRDEFAVTPDVLIPRPDTEILVEAVASRLGAVTTPLVLDIGTGSGCIALSLLRELPGARAVALDVSGPALEVAMRNARALGLEARVDLRLSRWLSAIGPEEVFDAVVSNPPYVSRQDEAGLALEVKAFEPQLALFAEAADDLSSYRAILSGIGSSLRPPGLLAFEVGLGQADRVAELIGEAGYRSVETLNDLASVPRVVIGRR